MELKELLLERERAKNLVRKFFKERGFLEVDTPILVPYENPDDNVENVKAFFKDFSGRNYQWFLHTSPEFFMKRLVWQLQDTPIFQISKVFRDGEVTDFHSVEFTMVEWYRPNGSYRDGMEETFQLIKVLFGKNRIAYRGNSLSLTSYEVMTVEEAFWEFAKVNLFSDEVDFFKLLVEKVEPEIAKIDKPVFLIDYPKELSAMAVVNGKTAERFELYLFGIEIANGYTELRDYDSYLKKFKAKGEKAVDKGFLKLLKEKPLPKCEGVALGFDRLLSIKLNKRSIHEVIPFSTKHLINEVNSNPL